MPTDLADPLENVWIFSWSAHALAHHPLAVFDANIFAPEHFTLAYAGNMLGLSVWVAPLFWATHNILAVNLAILGIYTTCGFGAYLLPVSWELRRQRPSWAARPTPSPLGG